MDIQRPSNARAKKIRRIAYGTVALLLLGGVTFGLSKLRPAAPSVDRATIWPDDVKRDPTVQRDAVDAEYQLKGAEADYQNLKVQVNSDLMSQKATEASVRSDYEQSKLQHAVDDKLFKEGIGAQVTAELSKVKMEQLTIRAQLESERTKIATDSAGAKLAAQQAKVEQMKALYELKKSQLEALHVRAGIDGVLQLLPVDVGQQVTPGMNLARVANPKKLRAEIKIAETQAKDVMPGQKASIDTRNGIVGGHVSRVD